MIVLFVYATVLTPQTNDPDVLNPIVESTVITEDPEETFPITFVFPGIVKVPSIKSFSSNPTKRPNL